MATKKSTRKRQTKKKPARKPGPKSHKKKPGPKPKPRKKKGVSRRTVQELPEQDINFEALLSELLPRQKEFLQAYYKEGTIADAARLVGVSRQAHHDVWMKKDEKGNYHYGLYAQLFESARKDLVELAEGALWRRGVKGVEEPVFWQGTLTAHKITKFDTTALIFWLKGNTKKYKERFEHTGKDGGAMALTIDAARQIAANFDKNVKKEKGKP